MSIYGPSGLRENKANQTQFIRSAFSYGVLTDSVLRAANLIPAQEQK
jgi:hypothetical protein